MTFSDEEMQTISFALSDYQWTIDVIKTTRRKLMDLLDANGTPEERLSAIRDAMLGDYGIIENLDRRITDGMSYLESEPICTIIDDLKQKCSGQSFQVENRVMNPVSFYHNLKLVGIARNREAYLSTLKQIANKHLTGCQALVGEELIDITENGELAHEPKDGPVIPEDTMEYLHWTRGVV